MHDSNQPLSPSVRLPSGVPGLDQILNGGLFSGGMYVVVGDPGSGKTILANQFCFHHLKSGGRVVYITMLAETHARMFQYLQSLSFFNPAEIGVNMHYFSGFQWLRDGGLVALLAFLRGEIRSLQPTLLILDGLALVTNLAESSTALRTFFHELQVFGEANGCTTLLLAHQSAAFPQPEYTLVDGIVVLATQPIGVRTVREIEVTKFRGSDYLQGKHHFRITNDGIQVDPRLEALLRYPSQMPAAPLARVSSGMPELDEMLHGGVFENTTTMIAGPSGSGKTLLGLHFLSAGVGQGI
ncbi:MAG TPA: ATPase domain-containing protein, partial [Herpetosiphonaceae bacterium]|nr:ATPase domain-containing protein [Herpetosiphonaceae bacterium]